MNEQKPHDEYEPERSINDLIADKETAIENSRKFLDSIVDGQEGSRKYVEEVIEKLEHNLRHLKQNRERLISQLGSQREQKEDPQKS